MITIYRIISPNNETYIGQTGNLLRRLKQLRWEGETSKSKRKVAQSIRKYGFDNFRVEILFKCKEEFADAFEKFSIVYFDTIESGLNTSINCYTKKHLTEEEKKKLSEMNKGNKHASGKRNKKQKKRIREALHKHYRDKKILIITDK